MEVIKKYSTVLLIVLIIIFGGFLSRIIEEEQKNISQVPLYHFYYIGKNSTDPYWKEIESGIRDAAVDHLVAVEYASPMFTDFQKHYEALDIGILSKVDGIITYGYTNEEFTKLIDKSLKEKVPLVTVESDNKESNRSAFIGTSSYRLGEEAADLLVKATGGTGDILLLRKNIGTGYSLDEELRIDGFTSRLRPYRQLNIIDVEINIEALETTESVIGKALQTYPEIKAIYTPTSVETIEAAKYIVNKNIVGQVVIVGIGNSKEAIHYIKRGIIYGTVMSDPYLMGYKSVEMLIQVSENSNISVVADTGLKINTYESVLSEEADSSRQE